MAQPTIYANIDCDGQVEVKVNNDTGYPCTIITNTGVNESIPSTGTDVYRNYNLTSSDWVKVVAAQDATIAANKLTGTIKYITSVTTTPAPTTTTTTTTPPAGNALPAGGADCDNNTNWPSSDNTKYQVTFPDTTTEWTYYYAGVDTKKLYMSVVGDPTTPISTGTDSVKVCRCSDGTFPCFFDACSSPNGPSLLSGFDMSAATSGKFSIQANNAALTGIAFDIWIDN